MTLKSISLASLVTVAGGCQFGGHNTDANTWPVEQDENTPRGISSSISELELKQARLWAKIDEIERIVLRQNQKLQILEQGFKMKELGATPTTVTPAVAGGSPPPYKDTSSAATISSAVQENFEGILQEGKRNYSAGRFSQAILLFSRAQRVFPPEVAKGQAAFWLARCWYELKEFAMAKKLLAGVLKKGKSTAKIAVHAKLWLAKVELKSGRRDKALDLLNRIVSTEHPSSTDFKEASELMATLEGD